MVRPERPSPNAAVDEQDGSAGHKHDGNAGLSIASLPDEILLLIFSDIQTESFPRHHGLSSLSPYKDLLSCGSVCRYWARLVPKILYRDVRISDPNVVSTGNPTAIEKFYRALLPVPGGLCVDNQFRHFVTVISLDVFSDVHPRVEYAFRILSLCGHLRAVSLHVHKGGSGANESTRPRHRGCEPLPRRVSHLRLSSDHSADLGMLLFDLLSAWPQLTHLDVIGCDILNGPDAEAAHLAQLPQLQHLRACSAHGWLIRLLAPTLEDRPLKSVAWKITSDYSSEAELLLLRLRTLYLTFDAPYSMRNCGISVVLSHLSSLRTLILGYCLPWSGADLADGAPEWLEEIGIHFAAGLCIAPTELRKLLQQRLTRVRLITIYLPASKTAPGWRSAQTAYCDQIAESCCLPVKTRPKSDLDFLNS